jgi:hypothetical protein
MARMMGDRAVSYRHCSIRWDLVHVSAFEILVFIEMLVNVRIIGDEIRAFWKLRARSASRLPSNCPLIAPCVGTSRECDPPVWNVPLQPNLVAGLMNMSTWHMATITRPK